MTRALAVLAAVILLAGCTPAPELPAPMTPEEAQQEFDRQNAEWWDSMFPDEPMPDIAPIAYVDPLDPGTGSIDCVRDAGIEGMSFSGDGWTYFGGDPATDRQVDLTVFTCAQEYPYDVSDPTAIGMLTEAERAWTVDFTERRLAPCLRMLGYFVPVGSIAQYGRVYYSMTPQPTSQAEWDRIDFACPPSPIGPVLRPQVGS